MPLPVIADVVRVTLNYETADPVTHPVNVMHFKRASSESGIPGLLTALSDELTGPLLTPCASALSLASFDVIPLFDSSTTSHGVPTVPVIGQRSGDWIPQVSALIKLTTGLRGRSHRGRIYLPAVSESAQDSNGISVTFRDDTTSAWDAFANTMITDHGWALGVASYKLRSFAQALDVACERSTATQRRRNHRL